MGNKHFQGTARMHFDFASVLDDIAAAVRPSRERQLEIRLEVAEGYLANGKAAQDADMIKTGEASVADIRRQLEQIEQDEQIALAHEIADEVRARLELRLPIAEAIASGDLMDAEYPADLLDARRAAFVDAIREQNAAGPCEFGSAAWFAGVPEEEV